MLPCYLYIYSWGIKIIKMISACTCPFLLSPFFSTWQICCQSVVMLQPQMLWTGKQLINILLRPNKKCPILCNLRAKGKPYKGRGEELAVDDSCKTRLINFSILKDVSRLNFL